MNSFEYQQLNPELDIGGDEGFEQVFLSQPEYREPVLEPRLEQNSSELVDLIRQIVGDALGSELVGLMGVLRMNRR